MCAETISNPRSALHALQPLGQGSDQAEGLLSYLCRLAASHRTCALELSRKLLNHIGPTPNAKYAWHDRQISGLSDAALSYVAALAATTTVTGLQLHTFLPWQAVIAANSLPLHKAGQFCTQCLYDDRQSGGTPYMRLCWEPTISSVCHRHQIALRSDCPHCGKTNIRHTRTFTVMGWCSSCHQFLGQPAIEEKVGGLPLWQSQQIAQLVKIQQTTAMAADKELLLAGIEQIITEACAGQYAPLARHLGMAKNTIHSWLRQRRVPGMDMSMRIARFAGIDVSTLLLGQAAPAQFTALNLQTALPLEYPSRPARTREVRIRNWEEIEEKLQAILRQPLPVSVRHAASVVQITPRMLYMHCNQSTRKISSRWLEALKRKQLSHAAAAWPYLEDACRQLLDAGVSPNMREIESLVPNEILNRVTSCWDLIRQVCEYIESCEFATAEICGNQYPKKLVLD